MQSVVVVLISAFIVILLDLFFERIGYPLDLTRGLVGVAASILNAVANLVRRTGVGGIEAPTASPWRRCFARWVDIGLWGVAFSFMLAAVAPAILQMPAENLSLIPPLLWMIIEAALLSTWGTTPGKWLLGLTLRDAEGRKPAFSRALKRSFSVWVMGFGVGLPVAVLLAGLSAFGHILRTGSTRWDRSGGFVVTQTGIRPLRGVVAALVLSAVGATAVMNLLPARQMAAPAVQARPDCRINGNVSKSGELIYHMPGQRYYNRTNPERWFCTEEEARKAGFRRSKV